MIQVAVFGRDKVVGTRGGSATKDEPGRVDKGEAWLLLAHKVRLLEGSIAVAQLRERYKADELMRLLEKAEARIPSLIEELVAK